tara:strand:- start:8235 stop:9740 length:1506 start_codon:yes stop_codon:yes gene_type:complete
VLIFTTFLVPAFVYSQEEQREPNPLPLIFDPVLIQEVPLAETDENGDPLYGYIELSSLPSLSDTIQIMDAEPLREDAPLNTDSLLESQTQYQEDILAFELEGGVYDSRLSELYLALGTTFQQLDDNPSAIEALTKSLQISRISNGLFSTDQVPIVTELIETYLKMDDVFSANQNQEYLFYILQKIYGATHPLLLAELLEYADWNLYRASLAMGYAPNNQALYFRTDFSQTINFNTQIENQQSQLFLLAASQAYSQSINLQHDLEARFANVSNQEDLEILKTSFNLSDDDLDIPQTEKKLAYTHFLLAELYGNFVSQNAFGEVSRNFYVENYIYGKDALERRYAYLQNSNSPTSVLTQALLDIADWFLLFERWTSAKDIYTQIFAQIESNETDRVKGLVYPDLPENIPDFLSSPNTRNSNQLSSEQVLEYEGYIDVSFRLNLNASPGRIRIIDQSEETSEATINTLIQKLRSSNFRLQLASQDDYADNDFLIRYYYTRQLEE